MDAKLLQQIDRLIEEDSGELAKDIIRLVNIKSVRGTPEPGAPFGNGPRHVLDAALMMGAERGFISHDYGMGVGSIAVSKGEIDLGIWTHGDVVPEGAGWLFEPYNATEYKGCIVGRGSADNKGQLASVLHLFSVFKRLGIKLKYTPALFVGSSEETGMDDVRAFLKAHEAPRISLVPDGAFPVGYGGKGNAIVKLRAKQPLESVILEAGRSDFPGQATAVLSIKDCPELETCTVEYGDPIKVIAQTPPRHSSSPNPSGNMITLLTTALIDKRLVSENDAKKLDFLRRISLDTQGRMMGLYTEPASMGELVLASIDIIDFHGKPEIGIKIRYPIETTFDAIIKKIDMVAQTQDFEISYAKNEYEPYLVDKNWHVIHSLTIAANEISGAQAAPYTLSGGTYAHILPNALVFGMSGNLPPEDFPAGHGGVHGIDECVSLERLQRAMRIYARALLMLDEMDW